MVLLNSAIREQRRDPKNIDNTSEIVDPNFVICEPYSLSASFGGFSPSLLDCEDLDLISEWICEPDCEDLDVISERICEPGCFEMANNQHSSFKLEEKQVREEFSPISFTLEAEKGVSSPSEVDNVGAKFGEVCLDGLGGLLSENGYFGDSVDENQFRREENESALLEKVCFENPIGKPQCPSGINEGVLSEQHACMKNKGISAGALNNVASSSDRVSVGGEYNRSSEISVADNILVERRGGSFEKCGADNVEVRFHGDRDFGQPVINCVEAEEITMGTSHNAITSGDGVLRTGALHIPKEEYVELDSSAQRTDDFVERIVPNKAEVYLERCGGFEHGVAKDKFSIVETDIILKEASHNVNLNRGGVPRGLVSGPPTILYDRYLEDPNLVQSMGDINVKQTEKDREYNNTEGTRKEDSDVESGEIVSYEDHENCTGMEEPDSGECSASKVALESEEDGSGMVESDSEYCSDSSSSSSSTDESEEEDVDDEEIEEGEIKPEKGRRKVQPVSLDYECGSSDEEGPKGPIRSKNEIQDLPPVSPVTVVLEKHHQLKSAGVITSVLGTSIVVEGKDCHTALNEGTILWITQKRLPLGLIDEVFGPVKNPYYLVRFNAIKDVPDFVKEGVYVSYVPEFSKYVLNDPSLYRKGYDASGDNDEELSEEIEFSDDEKEAECKRARSNAKRGAKSRQNALENKSDRAWKKQEFMDKRRTKLWGVVKSPHNGNHSNGLQGRVQETKFSSNKPFGNSSRNLPPVYNNGKQQSPQHFGPQSAPVKQVAVLPKESENLWHSRKMVSGAPSSWGRVNSKPNRDASGGIHSVQVPAVGGQSACNADHKVNSSGVVHSRALHDQAQGINFGQPHLGSMHDQMGQTFPQLHTGQPSSSAPFQQPVVGINSNQSPVLGGPMLNGNLINVNPMGFPSMPMFPALLGQPAQSSSIHPGSPVMGWNVGQPNNANQGLGNPLHFNQMQTCVGIPVLQNPGLHTNMHMGLLSNMGALPGHNVLPCPIPWGQPIPRGNLSQQFQTQLPSQNHGVSFSQSNNMSGNIYRLPHPSQPAKDRQS